MPKSSGHDDKLVRPVNKLGPNPLKSGFTQKNVTAANMPGSGQGKTRPSVGKTQTVSPKYGPSSSSAIRGVSGLSQRAPVRPLQAAQSNLTNARESIKSDLPKRRGEVRSQWQQ